MAATRTDERDERQKCRDYLLQENKRLEANEWQLSMLLQDICHNMKWDYKTLNEGLFYTDDDNEKMIAKSDIELTWKEDERKYCLDGEPASTGLLSLSNENTVTSSPSLKSNLDDATTSETANNDSNSSSNNVNEQLNLELVALKKLVEVQREKMDTDEKKREKEREEREEREREKEERTREKRKKKKKHVICSTRSAQRNTRLNLVTLVLSDSVNKK